MKVKELLQKLSKVNPELDVVVRTNDGYCYDIWGEGEIGSCESGIFVYEDEAEEINTLMLDATT